MGAKALAAYNTTKENAAEEPKISDNFLAWISFSKYSESAGSLNSKILHVETYNIT